MPSLVKTWNELVTFLQELDPETVEVEVETIEEPDHDKPEELEDIVWFMNKKEEEPMTTPQRNFITGNFFGTFGPYLYTITKNQARAFISEVVLAQKSNPDPVARQRALNRLSDQFLAKLKPSTCGTCGGGLTPDKGQPCHC